MSANIVCVVIDSDPDTEPARPDPVNTDEDRMYHMLYYYLLLII